MQQLPNLKPKQWISNFLNSKKKNKKNPSTCIKNWNFNSGYWYSKQKRIKQMEKWKRKEDEPLEGEERRNAAKTVTSRPWGFPFLGRELYKVRTFSDTLWPKLVCCEDEKEEDMDMVEVEEAIDAALTVYYCVCSVTSKRWETRDRETGLGWALTGAPKAQLWNWVRLWRLGLGASICFNHIFLKKNA